MKKYRFLKPLALAIFAILVAFTAWAAEDYPKNFNDVKWQPASQEDMSVFTPYIGTFRGQTYTSDEGMNYYFKIQYAWYDKAKTIVKFSLETVVPVKGQSYPLGEGYYRYDPFAKRIAAIGVFRDGRSGAGFVTDIDRETKSRTTRIHSKAPDGSVVEVRDTFWVISNDSFGNATYVSTAGGPWQKVSDETYTRLDLPTPK